MTSVPDGYAGGDNMSFAHSVLMASAAGAKAGMSVISTLLHR